MDFPPIELNYCFCGTANIYHSGVPEVYMGWGLCSDAPSAQDGDDLAPDVGFWNRAEVPAVLRLGAVVAQKEIGILRHHKGVGAALLGVGGVHDLAALIGAVDQQVAAVVQHDHIPGTAQNAAHTAPPGGGIDHHVIFGQVGLEAVGEHQIAVLHGGEHIVAADLGNQEHLGQQNQQHQRQGQAAQRQTDIALGDEDVRPAAADDLLNGQGLLKVRHRIPPSGRSGCQAEAAGSADCSAPVPPPGPFRTGRLAPRFSSRRPPGPDRPPLWAGISPWKATGQSPEPRGYPEGLPKGRAYGQRAWVPGARDSPPGL